jgi:hypothetical protein
LSGVTAVAGLVAGVIVSGVVGFAAAAVPWAFVPRRATGRVVRERRAAHD